MMRQSFARDDPSLLQVVATICKFARANRRGPYCEESKAEQKD